MGTQCAPFSNHRTGGSRRDGRGRKQSRSRLPYTYPQSKSTRKINTFIGVGSYILLPTQYPQEKQQLLLKKDVKSSTRIPSKSNDFGNRRPIFEPPQPVKFAVLNPPVFQAHRSVHCYPGLSGRITALCAGIERRRGGGGGVGDTVTSCHTGPPCDDLALCGITIKRAVTTESGSE